MLSIPGMFLRVYKQDRLLEPEEDGFLGKLYSGYVIIEARIAPSERIIGLQQQGRDLYSPARDWMKLATVPTDVSEITARKWWYRTGPQWYEEVGSKLPAGTQVFRHKVELDGNQTNANSFVPYPNNLMAVARYERDGKGFTNSVRVWKIALVSQHDDQYFLSVQQVYETTAHQNGKGACYPRLKAHPTLQNILVSNLPTGINLPPMSEYQQPDGPPLPYLRHNQGVVTNWYEARGSGVIMTKRGEAKVTWHDVPGRPRKAYLVPGEVVNFRELKEPIRGEKTMHRPKPRRSSFELQAYGLSLV